MDNFANDSRFAGFKPSRRAMLKNISLAAGAISLGGFSVPLLRAADDTAGAPIAKTTAGNVRGFVDQGVVVFKGIPYGDDTATRRFQPPVPPRPWTEIRDATAFGPAAPAGLARQATTATSQPSATAQSENCLVLNVWSPRLRDNGKRPVMVYIHGGAYSSGTGNSNLYDGVNLCRQGDVVVVTMNHRLNIFGYLYLAELGGPELADSGNVGMLDLVLMLQWVRDNIAEFGGDPNNVLIFGQSGGGAKCATLMAMPAAKGLFHRVISMSGQQVTAREPAAATKTALDVLAALGISRKNIEQLKTMPMNRVLSAMRGRYFGPVKDGRSVSRDPFDPDAPPQSKDIPMILGNCHDETEGFYGSDASLFELHWDDLPKRLEGIIRPFLGELKTTDVIGDYRKMYPNYSPTDVFFAATTAFRSWRSQLIEAERRAPQGNNTYVYQLNWGAMRNGRRWAGHASDIPLAFNNFGKGNDFGADAAAQDPDAPKLAKIVSDVFINFARTGIPSANGLPAWPAYKLNDRPTMIFDLPPRVENDPRGDERKLVETQPYTQPGTRDN